MNLKKLNEEIEKVLNENTPMGILKNFMSSLNPEHPWTQIDNVDYNYDSMRQNTAYKEFVVGTLDDSNDLYLLDEHAFDKIQKLNNVEITTLINAVKSKEQAIKVIPILNKASKNKIIGLHDYHLNTSDISDTFSYYKHKFGIKVLLKVTLYYAYEEEAKETKVKTANNKNYIKSVNKPARSRGFMGSERNEYDEDTVYFTKDDDGTYSGAGDIISVTGSTLLEAVNNAIAEAHEAEDYDKIVWSYEPIQDDDFVATLEVRWIM